jgi:cobalt-zinc-cadmium efflux system outer membrane protein
MRWVLVLALGVGVRRAAAQAPTLPTESPALTGPGPGSLESSLGPIPGAGAIPFTDTPAASRGGGILGGRVGTSFPRVPTAITNPAAGAPAPTVRRMAPMATVPITSVPLYGVLDVPRGPRDEGPPHGLTLDQAIELLLQNNMDLKSRFMEIPQAEADILTAGLRANPIFYADTQLVPYGQYTNSKPGGPLQYDVNITHPLDLNHKRWERVRVATRAKRVLEAQYQDAVRLEINNLYTAYVNVLSARETVRYAQVSLKGLNDLLAVVPKQKRFSDATQADVERISFQRDAAEVGLMEAEAALRQAKRTLGTLLYLAPMEAENLELRGTISDPFPPPSSFDDLARLALEVRPDLNAYRLGVQLAEANVRLARANQFQDVYLLYQPFTYQNNAPFGLKSPASWALGLTVPLPIYNRNQGVIQRARLNVTQSRMDVAARERLVLNEVQQAFWEYLNTRAMLRKFEAENGMVQRARRMRDYTGRLFELGETPNVVAYLNAQRDYNDAVRQYRDLVVRHRRSMLMLNTAVGQRILP